MKHDYIDKYSRLESPVHSIEPRAKALALFALIVICVSTPPEAWWCFVVYAGIVFIVATASRVPASHIISRALVVFPFILIVALVTPFTKEGMTILELGFLKVSKEGLITVWNVSVKSLISIIALILLSSTTPFPDLMRALERLKVPSFFTTVASFMYRYVFIIVDEAERMKRARDSRNFRGRWIWQAKTIGQMIASLFIRSHMRGERVYQAMCSRGFEGTFPRYHDRKMKSADVVFLTLITLTAVSARISLLW